MRTIKKLHNRFKNEPIWVVGSDPTLSSYPDDFLDDKIGITLHLAYLKYPEATFRYFSEYDRVAFLKNEFPEFVDQANIFGLPFYMKTEDQCKELIKGFADYYYLNLTPYPPRHNPKDIFSDIGKDAMIDLVGVARGAESNSFGGHGTCLHPAFFVAIMMGGNPINLIGTNHDSVGGRDHFGEAESINLEMRPETPKYSEGKGNRMRLGTEAIVQGCEKLGIKVNWYKNYEQIGNSNQDV